MQSIRERYEEYRNEIERQVLDGTIERDLAPDHATAWWDEARRLHADGGIEPIVFPYELLWSYWHEQGMLVQAMEAVLLRFQNRARGPYAALARFDISPLRPISHLLWGYIDDQHRRLTVKRRAYEYIHQYGLDLVGRAVGALQPADSRSRFLETFHALLHSCVEFYRQEDDRTVDADARPVLNAANALNFLLSYGQHNQFASLTLQARVEMTIVQRLFEFDEFRQFLGGPVMVNYPRRWMDRVDTLRHAMGWGDASIIEFWHLAVSGENLLLSIRFGPFGPAVTNTGVASGWATSFRDNVMQYIHSYRAVSGVDLSADPAKGQVVDATQPSVYLSAREQQHRAQLAM